MIFWKTVSVAQSYNHHCLNRMHPVFRLVEHDAGRAFEYFFRYFYAVSAEGFINPFSDFGFPIVEGGQAVHKFDLRVTRYRHQLGGNAVIF